MDFMFFLVGFKTFESPLKDVGNIPCYCNRCHNQSARAVKALSCVTLFFIPLLPFYYQKKLKCSICGNEGKFDDNVKNMMKQGQPVGISG